MQNERQNDWKCCVDFCCCHLYFERALKWCKLNLQLYHELNNIDFICCWKLFHSWNVSQFKWNIGNHFTQCLVARDVHHTLFAYVFSSFLISMFKCECHFFFCQLGCLRVALLIQLNCSFFFLVASSTGSVRLSKYFTLISFVNVFFILV